MKFNIIWDDESDNDGYRPSAVTLTLYADGVPVENWQGTGEHQKNTGTVTVNSGMCDISEDGNSWTYTFEGYQKYKDGVPVTYTVSVSDYNETQYTASYPSGGSSDTACVTLTHKIETAKVDVDVVWDDENNRDGNRPDIVTIELVAYQWNREANCWEDVSVTTTTLKGGSTAAVWGYRFDAPLPVKHGGQAIIYKAKVISDLNAHIKDEENGYDWTQGMIGNPASVFISHKTTTRSVVGTVHWDDNNNIDGKRPDSVVVQLLADGKPLTDDAASIVVSGDPNESIWSYTFKDLPRFRSGASGEEILYTIEVKEAVTGTLYNEYKAHYTTADGQTTEDLSQSGSAFVRLAHEPELADVPLTIQWDDENNRDGTRPESVTIELTAYQWNSDTYRWEEVSVETAEINGDMTAGTWTHTFADQKVYNGGQKIIYKANVTSNLNAHVKDDEEGYGWTQKETGDSVSVIISHKSTTRSVVGTIHWDDSNNNDGLRPTSVILRLYADGTVLEDAKYVKILNGDMNEDNWSYEFEGLPRFRSGASGEEILYTIAVEEVEKDSVYGKYHVYYNGQEEVNVKYTATYMGADGNETNDPAKSGQAFVQLTHVCDTRTIAASVSWHDEENKDGHRPSSVLVELYKQVEDKDTLIETLTITAGSARDWSRKVSGLPVYEGGKEITYKVAVSEGAKENLAAQGYTTDVQGSIVHLYYSSETGNVSAKLYWSDNDNNDNLRPDSVKVTLYANGKDTGKTLDLNEENGWTAEWTGLSTYFSDKNGSGQLVSYSVKVELPDGYTDSYTPEAVTTRDGQTIQIRLSHGVNLINVPVTVRWNDSGNRDSLRPAEVSVQLYANGEPVPGKAMSLTGNMTADTWTGVFENLPSHDGGKEIYYTVQVDDTITRSFDVMIAGTTLYLSHDVKTGDLYVSFRFDDANNADGKRPDGGYLQLAVIDEDGNKVLVEGANARHTIFFDADGKVNDYFRGLPLNSSGSKPLMYSVSVVWDNEVFGGKGEEYTVKYSNPVALSETSANQLVISASRAADTITREGHVYWFDNNNQRGNRPDSIEINLYNNRNDSIIRYRLDMSESALDENGNGKVVKVIDGSVVGTVTVDEWGHGGTASVWTYEISGLQKNTDFDGDSEPIYYSANALDTGLINWYNTTDTGRNGMNINLTHKNYLDDVGESTQNFEIKLDWLDNNNAWGYRPDSAGVDVTLFANGEEHKTVHLTRANIVKDNDNAWSYTFEKLPTYLNGKAVVWTASLSEVDRYATREDAPHADYALFRMEQSTGFDFTAHFHDSDNNDAMRPDTLGVEVYGDGKLAGTVTMVPSGTPGVYTASIKELPVWRVSGSDTAVQYTFRWTSGTNKDLENGFYSASATKNGSAVEAGTFYYLSTQNWGDKDDAGLNSLTGQYQWETTLTHDLKVRDVPGYP